MPSRKATKQQRVQGGGIDQRLVKALSHPHRIHALKILNERTASPNQLAPMVGTSVGRIAYHVRELERLDCIELVDTQQVRGATEHFYRATARAFFSDADWAQLPPTIRCSISGMMITEIWGFVGRAITAGTFDRRADRHLSWTPMVVDGKGWQDLHEILDDALHRMLDVQAESAARLAESGAEGESVAATLMCFETPEAS